MTAEVKRILMVGDLHANTGVAFQAIDRAAELDADVILQVGDFGFWPRQQSGRSFLTKVEARLARRDLELWWIDGNHEDFDRLDARPISPDGRRKISRHIWHLPRGFRWQWGVSTWVAAGGAISVDQYGRAKGLSWFPEEALTDEQADDVIAAGPAQVLVSHDAPLGVPYLWARYRQDQPAWKRGSFWPTGLVMASDEHQARIHRIVEGIQADRVFHGHHHVRYTGDLQAAHGRVRIEGLSDDNGWVGDLCMLVDADGYRITEPDDD